METAWLIELPMKTFNGPPQWWTADYSSIASMFSEDSLKAVRFSREEDANAVINMALKQPFKGDCIATKHQWGS